ncbi:MAG: efflux RND transporter periplasmic adaptor subunit [Desulfobacteraceae bacterium]|nr:MAG: efflux RND transporter periplasmic adaptor subunit [Desulfobacteraceae bacterium]
MKNFRHFLAGIIITVFFLPLFTVSAFQAAGEFDGLIEPRLVSKLGSPVPGVLDKVLVDRGDMVKEGQLVAVLQCSVEKATMDLARARAQMEATIKSKEQELALAERNCERLKTLYENKALPFKEWDDVDTKRTLARLQLSEALENRRLAELEYKRNEEVVKRMSIRSPVTGVVVERFLSPGEYVEDRPILEVAQVDPLYVEVVLPVEMLGTVKVGMKSKVMPEMPVGGGYTATVIVVDKVVDAASGTFRVRLELPNPEIRVAPGLKCKVLFRDHHSAKTETYPLGSKYE